MEIIRFGIIGYGVQGRTYCALLSGKAIPGLPLVSPGHGTLGAICVRREESAEQARRDWPGVPVFLPYEDMIRSGTCDAVIPTVPHYLHHEVAAFALSHGVHVLGEKPAAVRACDARKILQSRDEHPGAVYGVFFNQRTNKLWQELKAILDSGELGQIRRSCWIINSWWRPDAYYRQNPWRGTWGGEGGGVLVNQAPHQLDLWLWLCGMPTEVYSRNRNGAHRDITTENDVTMVASYENGATGTFITCTHDPLGTDRLEIDLDGGKIVVEDSRKATIYRLNRPEGEMNAAMTMEEVAMLTRQAGGGGLYTVRTLESGDPWGYQHSTVMENFALHLLTGSPLLADGEAGLRQVQLANASQLSAWLNRPVPVPCDEELYNQELNRRIQEEGLFPIRE